MSNSFTALKYLHSFPIPSSPPPKPLAKIALFTLSYTFIFSKMSYKCNHKIYSLLWLAPFIFFPKLDSTFFQLLNSIALYESTPICSLIRLFHLLKDVCISDLGHFE